MSFAERLEPRRLLAAGDLDAAFGSGGRRDIALTHPLLYLQRVVPVPGSSDILVVGQEIRRYRADGALDASFGGGDGVIPLPQAMVDADEYLENAAVLPNGKVIAVLRRIARATELHQIVAFDSNGSLLSDDLTSGLGRIDSFAVTPGGGVLAMGASQVARFTPELQLDSTFGVNGVTTPRVTGAAFDVAADGSIWGVGDPVTSQSDLAIIKYAATGQPDLGVGPNGYAAVDLDLDEGDTVADVEVASNGQLLTVIDQGNIGSDILRLDADGDVDASFNAGPAGEPTFGDISPELPRLTLLSDGKILLVRGGSGFNGAGPHGVTRLNANGSVDPAYGRVIANFPGQGIWGANDAGQVFLTANGAATTLALYRLASGGATPSSVRLDGSTVIATGTDGVDLMTAQRSDADHGDDLIVFARVGHDVGRVFEPSAVALMSFDALAGNDVITTASAGNIPATVSGGDGDDKILGGDASDSLSGNAGRDTIYGGNGADRLGGNGARDKLIGEGGADRLFGGPSGDWLLGAGGNDQLFGEGGNDQIQGGSANDILHANAGDDTLISNDSAIDNGGWIDELYGDGGRDSSIADPNDLLSSIEVRL